MQLPTREAWLNAVAAALAPTFADLGAPLPDHIRIAIGFTSRGIRGRAIGECWDNRRSEDGHFEVFIRPDLVERGEALAVEVAAILAHELAHAAAGIAAGHGPEFRKVAVGLGLDGPMRATVAGARFRELVAPILESCGPLPHGRLRSFGEGDSTRRKPQAARLVKCHCATCGYTVRTTRIWLDAKGPPHCPDDGVMVVEEKVEPEPVPEAA